GHGRTSERSDSQRRNNKLLHSETPSGMELREREETTTLRTYINPEEVSRLLRKKTRSLRVAFPSGPRRRKSPIKPLLVYGCAQSLEASMGGRLSYSGFAGRIKTTLNELSAPDPGGVRAT